MVDYFNNVIEIVAVSGDNHLGGNDFDKSIATYFCTRHNIDINSLSPQKQATLIRLAERAKKNLQRKKMCFYIWRLQGKIRRLS